MKQFIRTLIANFLRCFSIRYLPWHILAVALTAGIVLSGLDWRYLLATKDIYRFFFPTVIIGAFLPILLPLSLLGYSRWRRNERIRLTAWALAQAALLGSLVSSFYKIFTGRIQPDLANYSLDISHGFQFGVLRHGIFWGWPSSHTTIAFAMAVTIVVLYAPRNRTLSYAALIYALYIGIGVSMSIHWLSDAVAGVIIGSIVGIVVGKSFRPILDSK